MEKADVEFAIFADYKNMKTLRQREDGADDTLNILFLVIRRYNYNAITCIHIQPDINSLNCKDNTKNDKYKIN